VKKFFEEFKAFITKGNVVDMAVAVIIGGAFNKIVTSLVNDVIMPLVSLLVGGMNVTDWKWIIKEADEVAGTAETALNYGNFIQMVLDFLIIAMSIFVMLKVILALQTRARALLERKKEEEAAEEEAAAQAAEPAETQEDILKDIRELLRKNN
jgi:large conductance mechanosensitive channel